MKMTWSDVQDEKRAELMTRIMELELALGHILSRMIPKYGGYALDGLLLPELYEKARRTCCYWYGPHDCERQGCSYGHGSHCYYCGADGDGPDAKDGSYPYEQWLKDGKPKLPVPKRSDG